MREAGTTPTAACIPAPRGMSNSNPCNAIRHQPISRGGGLNFSKATLKIRCRSSPMVCQPGTSTTSRRPWMHPSTGCQPGSAATANSGPKPFPFSAACTGGGSSFHLKVTACGLLASGGRNCKSCASPKHTAVAPKFATGRRQTVARAMLNAFKQSSGCRAMGSCAAPPAPKLGEPSTSCLLGVPGVGCWESSGDSKSLGLAGTAASTTSDACLPTGTTAASIASAVVARPAAKPNSARQRRSKESRAKTMSREKDTSSTKAKTATARSATRSSASTSRTWSRSDTNREQRRSASCSRDSRPETTPLAATGSDHLRQSAVAGGEAAPLEGEQT
mmetsp:Transcript_16848/g.58796  ORF Transcript_16848/g.58796 Transcript_16848/m.58796 type:complete len:333 (-) Transcript_16848:1476-2474(-)